MEDETNQYIEKLHIPICGRIWKKWIEYESEGPIGKIKAWKIPKSSSLIPTELSTCFGFALLPPKENRKLCYTRWKKPKESRAKQRTFAANQGIQKSFRMDFLKNKNSEIALTLWTKSVWELLCWCGWHKKIIFLRNSSNRSLIVVFGYKTRLSKSLPFKKCGATAQLPKPRTKTAPEDSRRDPPRHSIQSPEETSTSFEASNRLVAKHNSLPTP